MKARIFPQFIFALALAGCSTTAMMTPISGPATILSGKAIRVKIDGIAGHSGKLSFTQPDGEFVSGDWISVNGGTGMMKGAATARGNKGSVFDVEFDCDHFARGVGKATDNHGNTYRVLVRGI